MTWRDVVALAIAVAMIVSPCVALVFVGQKIKRRLTKFSPKSELVRRLRISEIVIGLGFTACMAASMAVTRFAPEDGRHPGSMSSRGLYELVAVWLIFALIYIAANLAESIARRKMGRYRDKD
jgi:hypothetical protein